ncbi:hypothetical protein ACFFP0_19315 [Rhizobium puerariae]|uniref:Uncharacterized protein n=1 Tax=Rhizobium puerariae TaxID=1585791 RepID=A0ABV6AK51_9HYPH
MTVRQCDLARHIGLSPMTISRAVRMLGRGGANLSDHVSKLVLVAGELNRLGLAWQIAMEIVRKFEGEVRYLLRDPAHRTWVLFVERDTAFQIACISASHYDSVSRANPLCLTLALHEPVASAIEQFEALRTVKDAA